MKNVSSVIGIILAGALISAFVLSVSFLPLSETNDSLVSEQDDLELPSNSNFTALVEDLNNLPELKDRVDLKEQSARREVLLLLESEDPEIAKAFLIMQMYGKPSNFTTYAFPTYNTQLEVLFWLAEARELSEYDRTALAIALDYGAVLGISDEAVRDELRDYVVALYDYFVETDGLVPWAMENYPLEVDVALVWGANGINHPLFFETKNQYPEGTTYSEIGIADYHELTWIDAFREEKMTEKDFDWLFVDVSTLKEMRAFLLHEQFREGLEGFRVASTAESVDTLLTYSLMYHTDKPTAEVSYVEVEGELTPGCGLSNPDWQWAHFKEEGCIIGNCRDVTCMNIFFLKSLNVPAVGFKVRSFSSSFGHNIVVFYDYGNARLWRCTSNQASVIRQHVTDSKLLVGNYYPIVWSNWHEVTYPQYGHEILKTLETGFEIGTMG
jgi:hypothetical protein